MDDSTDADVRHAISATFKVHWPRHALYVQETPYRLPGFGIVADISMYSKATYRGPKHLVCVIPEGREHEASALLARMHERLGSMNDDVELLQRAMDGDLCEILDLEEIDIDQVELRTTEHDIARRHDVLARSMSRFEEVAAHVQRVYGLRLPRHVGVFDAFLRSLSPIEDNGLSRLWRTPSGIMRYFDDDGLTAGTRDNLDERLESRYRCDPPEFVTLMHGDSDGLHYGLWYDDPAELPSGIAQNYARDSAETSLGQFTAIDTLLYELEAYTFNDPYADPDADPITLGHRALRDVLRWFQQGPQAEAIAQDGPVRYRDIERSYILGTVCPALDPSHGEDTRDTDSYRVSAIYRDDPELAQVWIEEARRELKQGRPAMAMILGHELHWVDSDTTRDVALELLVGAYEALGRDALAAIARVHYAHRDLRSVGVINPRPPGA